VCKIELKERLVSRNKLKERLMSRNELKERLVCKIELKERLVSRNKLKKRLMSRNELREAEGYLTHLLSLLAGHRGVGRASLSIHSNTSFSLGAFLYFGNSR